MQALLSSADCTHEGNERNAQDTGVKTSSFDWFSISPLLPCLNELSRD